MSTKGCSICKELKPLERFGKRNGGKYFKSACRDCDNAISLKKYHQNRDYWRTLYKSRKAANLCVQCGAPTDGVVSNCPKHRKSHSERSKRTGKMRRARYKEAVFDHYGRVCACCGEHRPELLQIDHINGGGNKHHKEVGLGGMFRWIYLKGFPSGFQTLCANCNWAKGRLGGCPHKLNMEASVC